MSPRLPNTAKATRSELEHLESLHELIMQQILADTAEVVLADPRSEKRPPGWEATEIGLQANQALLWEMHLQLKREITRLKKRRTRLRNRLADFTSRTP